MPIYLTFGVDSVSLQVDISGTPGLKFWKNSKILFLLFHFKAFFEKCEMPRVEHVTDDLSTGKS